MIRSLSLVCMFSLLLASPVAAQSSLSDSEGISAVGSEVLKLKPSRLRLVMWVEAQGGDPKGAINALNTHKARVQKELEGMKADAASIRFSSTQLTSGGDPNQQRQMQYMQRQMMQQLGQAGMELPKVHTARAALTAEWALPVQEGDALALLPATLQEQIDKRDFAGKKNTPQLDAEAQEQLEELQSMMENEYGGGYYDSSDSSSQPTIYFVASVPPEEIKQAVGKAFTTAAGKAKLLSEAAGVALGKLKSVRTTSSDEMMAYAATMDPYAYAYGRGSGFPAELVRSNESTVVSPSIDSLQVNVGVIVTYSLEWRRRSLA